jgi:hypothetical protein
VCLHKFYLYQTNAKERERERERKKERERERERNCNEFEMKTNGRTSLHSSISSFPQFLSNDPILNSFAQQ